ncbi:hypothetical protein [Polaribacter vadi]|uniref:hypothetical protein n=1 Tax=Polaribacter vadi TaxID=1774273 RepID=UPI00111227D1|nr:hypothetical protein [Polaribacter vadi]
MKRIIQLFATLLISVNIVAQLDKPLQAILSKDINITIDSVDFYQPVLELEILDIKKFTPEQIETPEKAIQLFTSFTTYEVGHALISDDYYDGFPSERTLENRNKKEFRENLFLDIYYTLYFVYKGQNHASICMGTYGDSSITSYITVITLKDCEGKWLLANDRNISRLESIEDLKPNYAISLLLGKNLPANSSYSELFSIVIKNGVLDFIELESQMPKIVFIKNPNDKDLKFETLLTQSSIQIHK